MAIDGQARILVIDDDGVARAMLASVLEREGYDIAIARDGTEGLGLVQSENPDLVLLDVTMPGLDGYAVCREIRAMGPPTPPVIFLTSHGDTDARVTGLESGGVDYVVKPFDPAELLARVRAALRTKLARDDLAARAATDALTGLINRRHLHVRAIEAIELARRHERPLACLMIDLDSFKEINDAYGHAAGDAALLEAVRIIRGIVRMTDVAARYGGDEFLILFPETSLEDATRVAERIRAALATARIVVGSGDVLLEASLGVAAWEPGMSRQELFAAADRALYRAKQLGRDRVAVATADS